MALLWHSIILFFITAAGIVVSLQDFPDPDPPFSRIEKMLDFERKWLGKPWGWKKGLQTFGVSVSIFYVFWVCWIGSVMALLLFIGICVNISCVYGNKAMGIDEL